MLLTFFVCFVSFVGKAFASNYRSGWGVIRR